MAFMGRGNFPSIRNDNVGDSQNNDKERHSHYRGYGYYRRAYYYVPLDNTYVIMQMIATFIILIVGLVTYFTTYKSTIIDPIEGTKRLFTNAYLIIIGILLAITLLTNFFSKNELSLIKKLASIFVISIVIMLTFLGIKLKLDNTYTRDKFEQIYTQQNINVSSNETSKSKIDIGLTGISIKTEKEYYIDECAKLYGIFSVKAYGTIRTSSFAKYFAYLPNSENIKNSRKER